MREHFPFQEAQNAIVDMLHDYLAEKEHAERLEAENARLKAEVERLRKAGDAMFDCIQALRQGRYGQNADNAGGFRVCLAWRAAKMNELKPDYILQNSLDVGCGVVIGGKRWLVKELTIETHPEEKGVGMFLSLAPWESIDPTLYRLKPKRRRKKKGEQR